MHFLHSARQQTSIVRDIRVQKTTAAEHKLPNNEQWTKV